VFRDGALSVNFKSGQACGSFSATLFFLSVMTK
jgi:hypothetical protein